MTQLIHTGEEVHVVQGRERYGDCHRCGWAQPLHKVRVRRSGASYLDRAEVMTRGSVWLCDECTTDVSTGNVPERADTSRVEHPSPSSPDRVVA